MAYKVYISSTRSDLKEYRLLARDTIWRMGMLPIIWEDFNPNDTEEEKIREADLFVGIYAHRYGGGPPEDRGGTSYQELEFDWAVKRQIPLLLYFARDNALWPADQITRGEKAEKLAQFKERMKKEVVINYFSSLHEMQANLLFGLRSASANRDASEGILSVKPIFGPPAKTDQFKCDLFMIMPFLPEFQTMYTDCVLRVSTELNLTLKRGDIFFSEHPVMTEIWAAISACRVVIVEATGRNANVFYELGIAHTLGKTAIILTQNIDDVPFDLRHLRFIPYENTPEGLVTLSSQLKTAIQRLS